MHWTDQGKVGAYLVALYNESTHQDAERYSGDTSHTFSDLSAGATYQVYIAAHTSDFSSSVEAFGEVTTNS